MTALLFSPYALRGVTLPNRIVVSPMAQYSAAPDGRATDWHMMHVGNLLVSGSGLVIMEATAVEPRGRVTHGCLGLWNDAQAAALAPIVGFARQHGQAALGIQLAHAGRKGSVGRPWEGQRPLAAEAWTTIGPSGDPYPGRPAPAALDEAGLATLREEFAAAARRAGALGFDLIELHAAHGYLLHSFLSPLSNTRNDGYGGDLTGRMRFPLEVFAAVRAAFPADRPVGVRISATDWLPGGWDSASSVAFARALKAAGCDYVTASSGGLRPEQKIPLGPGYQVPFAAEIQRATGLPAMAVGMLDDPDLAERVLQAEEATLIALGRGMTWNPRWPWHAAEALGVAAPHPPQYARSQANMRRGDMFRPQAEPSRA